LYQASVQWDLNTLVGPMPAPGITFPTSSMRTDAVTEKRCKQIED